MKYTVEFTPKGASEFDNAFQWQRTHSDASAERWLLAFENLLDRLENNPEQFPKVTESLEVPVALKQALFGPSARPTYRLVFTIRPTRVMIYAVRHHAQRDLTTEEL